MLGSTLLSALSYSVAYENCSLEVWEDENIGSGIKEAVEAFEEETG